MATILRSAREFYRRSLLLTREAVADARAARDQGPDELAITIATHQVRSATLADTAVQQMLLEQQIQAEADAMLNSLAFTTEVDRMLAMIEQTETDYEFDRLVTTLVSDSGNAAAGVAIAARPRLAWVRHVSPPCCKRCAILAGSVYKWSDGFERHPNCRCVHIPTTVSAARGLTQDPDELVAQGLVSDLTGAEVEALMLGADLGQVVNVRRQQAGLTTSGRVLARRGRLTPEGALAQADGDRDRAVELLANDGYLDTSKVKKSSPAPGRAEPPTPPGPPPAPPGPPTPAGDPEPDPIDWAARQAALGIETNGETLGPDDVLLAEHMVRAEQSIEWIRQDANGYDEQGRRRPTDDFIWLNRGRLQVEGKRVRRAEYKPIKRAIADAVEDARRIHDFAKPNFIIDIGGAVLTERLRRQLERYNERNTASGNAIEHLWVLSRDTVHEIDLR